jgi:hypothetical protein
LIEDFLDIDKEKCKAFQQIFVLWFLLISSLFTENACNSELVDDCVRLFLSFCVCYGALTRNNAKNPSTTKGRGIKLKQYFLETLQTISVY